MCYLYSSSVDWLCKNESHEIDFGEKFMTQPLNDSREKCVWQARRRFRRSHVVCCMYSVSTLSGEGEVRKGETGLEKRSWRNEKSSSIPPKQWQRGVQSTTYMGCYLTICNTSHILNNSLMHHDYIYRNTRL